MLWGNSLLECICYERACGSTMLDLWPHLCCNRIRIVHLMNPITVLQVQGFEETQRATEAIKKK